MLVPDWLKPAVIDPDYTRLRRSWTVVHANGALAVSLCWGRRSSSAAARCAANSLREIAAWLTPGVVGLYETDALRPRHLFLGNIWRAAQVEDRLRRS